MILQTLIRWVIAGWFSAAVLNFAAPLEETQAAGQAQSAVLHGEVETLGDPRGSSLELNASAPAPEAQAAADEVPPLPTSEAESELPATPSPSEEYTVQPEDVLQITVYEEPDLTTKARVSMNGEINFPLLGRLSVAGLSVMEVQEKIAGLLEKDYLVNPQVQVFIETYHARDVFVTGAVNQPGSYPLPAGKTTTLMEAIAMAGGFSEDAALNKTRIIRIEEEREKTIHIKANDIIRKGDKSKDVEVRPNDVIFVPESFF